MTNKQESITREQWLINAAKWMETNLFHVHNYDVPELRISCGWTSGGRKGKAIGECWTKEAEDGGEAFQIFISPCQADSPRVMDILAHEMVHAVVGLKCGHKGAFKRCATAIGLTGKMTATVAGKPLHDMLSNAIKQELGEFPHSKLNRSNGKKKQGTRLMKLTCDHCSMVIRTTRKWIDETGEPTCACGGPFICD